MNFFVEKTQFTLLTVEADSEEMAVNKAMSGDVLQTRPGNIAYAVRNSVPVLTDTAWPLMLQPMKLLAQPGDVGLGDIVERVIGPVGGEAYKKWYLTIFGRPCGCTKRKDMLNQRYPLPKTALTNSTEPK